MGLYNGISASLLRQLTYSTARFGIYEVAKQQLTPKDVSSILHYIKYSFNCIYYMLFFINFCIFINSYFSFKSNNIIF